MWKAGINILKGYKVNGMQLIKVSTEIADYKSIKKLYKKAFPRNERAPFFLLMKKAKLSAADFWALYDEEKWVGLVYVIKSTGLAYIFYLAIKESERGRGYGRKAMDMIKSQYSGCRIFLALEQLDRAASNYEQRVSRHSFYEKCGLSDLPYKLKEATVVYAIMGVGGAVEPEEYRRMMENYMGRLLVRLIDMRIIK